TVNEILLANGDTKVISDIDSDSVKKTGKPLQIVQGLLRYGGEPPLDDDVESEESDDDDYQTRGQIYSQYVNKTQTETITGSSDSFAGVKCGLIQIKPNGNNYNQGLRISRFTKNYCGIYLGCDPNSTIGTLTDQWNISNKADGEFIIGLGAQVVQANRGLVISAD
ncbi:MAG: hypothetical protein EZS28_048235, partial [Streblomastix strix]